MRIKDQDFKGLFIHANFRKMEEEIFDNAKMQLFKFTALKFEADAMTISKALSCLKKL